MVVVLKESRLVYIEEPRTASRSTHAWLREQLGGIAPWPSNPREPDYKYRSRHMGPVSFMQMVQRGELPPVGFIGDAPSEYSFFVFTFNPYAAVVTPYVKACSRKFQGADNEAQIYDFASRAGGLGEFLRLWNAAIPGSFQEEEYLNRVGACDHILRFEDGYPGSLFDFLRREGVKITQAQERKFPRYGATHGKRANWKSYYDDEAKEFVADVYRTYLDRYGYTFDD